MYPAAGQGEVRDTAMLVDACGRRIDHLRLSLIDHCNLACRYCVTEDRALTRRRIDADFAFALVRWLSERHGVKHVRLTGGEPLLYTGLVPLIARLSSLSSLEEVTLTTNAQALAAQAQRLRRAGLARVNISLDTIDPRRFAAITRGGDVARTLRGIEAAVNVGLSPVRINVVVQRGVNDDELVEIAEWGMRRGCVVRFLEVMPIGPMSHVVDRHLVPASRILETLGRRFVMRPLTAPSGQPATDYAIQGPGVRGVVGVIASTTRPFCDSCRRMRISAQGHVLACLFDQDGAALSEAWDGRVLDEQRADALLQTVVAGKRPQGQRSKSQPMIAIGG